MCLTGGRLDSSGAVVVDGYGNKSSRVLFLLDHDVSSLLMCFIIQALDLPVRLSRTADTPNATGMSLQP
jgi:hypothetical protein